MAKVCIVSVFLPIILPMFESLLSPKLPPAQAEDSDQVLIERVKRDPEVFGQLMERYEQPLMRYVMRLTGWAEVEVGDILQESFIKAYRHLNDYDVELKFSTWLYRITHNQTIDTLRKQNVRPVLNLSLEDAARFVATGEDLAGTLARQEDLAEIRRAIQRLPLIYRDVLVLRFLEEKSYEEIMDIVQMPKGSVASLISRGRALLLKDLKRISLP